MPKLWNLSTIYLFQIKETLCVTIQYYGKSLYFSTVALYWKCTWQSVSNKMMKISLHGPTHALLLVLLLLFLLLILFSEKKNESSNVLISPDLVFIRTKESKICQEIIKYKQIGRKKCRDLAKIVFFIWFCFLSRPTLINFQKFPCDLLKSNCTYFHYPLN